ncbi:MAG TPA: hypothetical protein VMV59_00045 [Candidatus Dormibacteraeota bacterium]|nr:hypothetical protein [Candidatus Dormibacteraeota bacterium]
MQARRPVASQFEIPASIIALDPDARIPMLGVGVNVPYAVSASTRDGGFAHKKVDTPNNALAWVSEFRDRGATDIRIINEEKRRYITEQELEDLANAQKA